VAEVYAGFSEKAVAANITGAVLRVSSKNAYQSARFSAFSSGKLPEAEFLVPGVISSRNIEILNPATGAWLGLSTPEGMAFARGLGGK
jgi:hypothetical protein